MQFSARFRHIDSQFGFETEPLEAWTADYENADLLTIDLNRMAIASSQHAVLDFPEVEICGGQRRATVRAINGQLFYSDLQSQNRKDLKVLPTEVARLLEGQSLDTVFQREEADVYEPLQHQVYRSGSSRTIGMLALIGMCVVLGLCSTMVWRDVSDQPRLYREPEFVASSSQEREVLRQYADVYVSEYREGAMLFELSREGQLSRYEMWHSEEQNDFVLIPVDSYPVQVGQHEGQTAMLANETYLLLPVGDEMISLHGINYSRHHGPLSTVGKILNSTP
ncbi:hypothetical protein QEH52_04970 [Coraliomargarita sp. SDUM461003]|uniref:Uncharacterized protein n=1 Tax=Thalassobacterium maritimum TaxID=3041265 RepID=A0ABU1ARR0_9BACT|nr:hypothetical protein [Coraliomargarita sp. SDUM461003]MDQ8206849.1 hypothetical protein [Coraliomargarita sp. SDUM461003]